MLYAQALRSKYPHARLLKVDVSKAKALAGVASVLTADDVPGRKDCGVHEVDWPVLCYDKVRYVGDAIALVVDAVLSETYVDTGFKQFLDARDASADRLFVEATLKHQVGDGVCNP